MPGSVASGSHCINWFVSAMNEHRDRLGTKNRKKGFGKCSIYLYNDPTTVNDIY